VAIRLDPFQNIISVTFPAKHKFLTIVVSVTSSPQGIGGDGGQGGLGLGSASKLVGRALTQDAAYGIKASHYFGPHPDPSVYDNLSALYEVHYDPAMGRTRYYSYQEVIDEIKAATTGWDAELKFIHVNIDGYSPGHNQYWLDWRLMGPGEPGYVDLYNYAFAFATGEDFEGAQLTAQVALRPSSHYHELSYNAAVQAYSGHPKLTPHPESGTITVDLTDEGQPVARQEWSGSISLSSTSATPPPTGRVVYKVTKTGLVT
jgi:hypothetical protein